MYKPGTFIARNKPNDWRLLRGLPLRRKALSVSTY